MRDYFNKREYFIDRIWFQHDQNCYHGSGIMYWDPNEGFHIASRVRGSKSILSKEVKQIEFTPMTTIYIELEKGLRAIAPRVYPDDLGLSLGRLSLDTSSLIFMQMLDKEIESTNWNGFALYETKTNLTLTDSVRQETVVGDWGPSQSYSRSGIYQNEN
jgi:hypothetical protein